MTAGLLPPGGGRVEVADPPGRGRPAGEAAGLREAFTEAMSQTVSRPAVVTARRDDGTPVGLLVSSLSSFSVRPPSVLLAVDVVSRSHPVLATCDRFGVHLLAADQAALAWSFADRAGDRFTGPDWRWHGDVPRLTAAPVFLDCVPARRVTHGDHLVLIGDVAAVDARPASPLLHHRRSLDWRIAASGA